MITQNIVSLMNEWSVSFNPTTHKPIDRTFAHKNQDANVFISRFERITPDIEDEYLVLMSFNSEHPYFYEHERDHVPGMMLVEGARQCGLVGSHQYYGVPFSHVFVLDTLDIKFNKFAEKDHAVFSKVTFSGLQHRKGTLSAAIVRNELIQAGEKIGEVTGAFAMRDRRLLARLRRRQQPSFNPLQSEVAE